MRLAPTLLTHAALTILTLSLGTVRAAEPAMVDLMIVLPLDTAAVTVDSNVNLDALREGKSEGERARRNQPSPASLVARSFHPRVGDALARLARRVEVIDSSNARVSFHDPDSSRFALSVTSLSLTQSTRTFARRTVPTSPPGIDPVTGALTPGVRRAYSEGPGRMTTVTATATWVIRDVQVDSVYATGTAKGEASSRGEPRHAEWDAAARTLAHALLQASGMTP